MTTPLTWQEKDGGLFLDLADGGEGAGTWLAVRPHAEPEYWRPVCVLVPGEEERELGGVFWGREHAPETLAKYAIQTLAHLHRFPPAPREADLEDEWPKRTTARLWLLLTSAPHGA
jgi:hypothetical protein